MIQELFGGGPNRLGEERTFSINGGIFETSPLPSMSSPTPTPTNPSSTTTATTAAATGALSENQNLRCPRCDSSNTKFCYYNNYNLTQPRHFCKTCRRYWTKGGALRNVPIGGGCRKNKPTTPSSVGKSNSACKFKSLSSEIVGRSNLVNGFDHELPSNPILWSSPQNSHLLALLKTTQNQNPNPNPNHIPTSHIMTETLNSQGMEFDQLNTLPSLDLCSSLWRNNHQQVHHHPQQNGVVFNEVQSNGMQELYQKLKLSTNYYSDNSQFMGNVGSSSSSSSGIVESISVAGNELGYCNPSFSWSDLPTANGAYH